ncbi:MAG: glycosyltransferase [Thermoleophilia bacterium]|nr:glycosyltransferase [Thermoleophilia bacterium]
MTGEDEPLVSVLMASHNASRWVAESIDSVLAQTYPRVELVVADDASADGTRDVVAAYAARHPGRVRLLPASARAGPARRRNDALAAARGPLLARLDHDDVWLPEKLAKQVAVLRERPDVGLVYTGYEAFDSDTGAVVPWRDEALEAEGDVLADLFVKGCFIASLTVLFRREGLERRGVAFREADFSFGDDYFLWLVLALDWKVARVNEVLARYRRHADNESTRLARSNYHLARIRVLRDFLAAFPEARTRLRDAVGAGLAGHYLDAAAFEFERGRSLRGRALVLRALAAAPRRTLAAIRQG